MLMCFSAGIVGSLVFLQRRSLVGEALSHAAYPGVVLSVLAASLLFPFTESLVAIFVLIFKNLGSSFEIEIKMVVKTP